MRKKTAKKSDLRDGELNPGLPCTVKRQTVILATKLSRIFENFYFWRLPAGVVYCLCNQNLSLHSLTY